MGRDAEGDRARDLHLVEHAGAQRLLVKSDVIATPNRRDQQVRLRRDDLGDMGGEVGGTELRPAFRNDFRSWNQVFEREGEVFRSIAPITLIWVDVAHLANLRPLPPPAT